MRPKFIAICTPTLGMVSIEWASVLRAIAWPLNTGYTNFFMTDTVGGEVAEGRNKCVCKALSFDTENHEVTHLFWLDDDVIASRMALMALLRHDRDIASGVYFTRCEMAEPLLFPGRGAGTIPFPPDQFLEVWGHGMGLTLVKADVYRRMMKEGNLGVDKYGSPQWYKTTGIESMTREGDTLWTGGTEDLYFLNKAGEMGYKPLADCSKFAFGWHYDSRTRQGYPKKQWAQKERGEKITWDTPKGVVTWE